MDESAFVYSEIQAVAASIPPQLKTYVLWQLGHGDLQQVVVIDGKPQTSTLSQAEGIAGAINKFATLAGLSEGEALKAWHSNTVPEKNGMNGRRIDATKYKKIANRNPAKENIDSSSFCVRIQIFVKLGCTNRSILGVYTGNYLWELFAGSIQGFVCGICL